MSVFASRRPPDDMQARLDRAETILAEATRELGVALEKPLLNPA